MQFTDTRLWKRTLAPAEPDDGFNCERDKLRTALLGMRERVKPLVAQAHQDCDGLTVHDVTHLDALWEMADLIAGDGFSMNPVEGFVFGASVLLHDAGMALAAFEGGLESIKQTAIWRDTVAGLLRLEGIQVSDTAISIPPANLLPIAIFSALRALHAEKAEGLATQHWTVPNSKEPIPLLDDRDFRDFYGKRIGRIAHSHHWSVDEVGKQFVKEVGAHSSLPSDWTLNEIKVACLLRCADAAHIDQRRAPTMLLALKQPTGISREHWGFQNKLSRPAFANEELVYSSGQDFGRNEASQWWLCFDTVRMIDGEIRKSNALLRETDTQCFLARGVRGIDSARLFARDVKPTGWEPVDAEVKVSDPIHLALTLGGRNLYGMNELAPIRELIQNGFDAVRARRQQRKADISFGLVRVTVEKSTEGDSQFVWLHVDDNGIGMSERILTGPLIDFGKSIWSSPLLRDEYPGVEAADIRPIGKFGIGFFSVFLLGSEVKVISRRSDGGVKDIRVLEFDRLTKRPLLRRSHPNELPEEFCTRVSIRLNDPAFMFPKDRPSQKDDDTRAEWTDIAAILKRMVSAANVRVEFKDGLSDRSFLHDEKWETVAPEVFLGELLAPLEEKFQRQLIATYSSSLATIDSGSSDNRGRASLNYTSSRSRQYTRQTAAYRSVGGLVTSGGGSRYENYFMGVMPGETNDASRRGADVSVTKETISDWASKQVPLLNREKFTTMQLVSIAQLVHSLGGKPGNLPFCVLSGRVLSLPELTEYIRKNSTIYIRVKSGYGSKPSWLSVNDLRATDFVDQLVEGLLVYIPEDSSRSSEIVESGKAETAFANMPLALSNNEPGIVGGPMAPFFKLLKESWGNYTATLESTALYRTKLAIGVTSTIVVTCKRIN